jgi:hypothetical protein
MILVIERSFATKFRFGRPSQQSQWFPYSSHGPSRNHYAKFVWAGVGGSVGAVAGVGKPLTSLTRLTSRPPKGQPEPACPEPGDRLAKLNGHLPLRQEAVT